HNDSVIVQCESCQARFRVSDEKVTDRGVRVRCTGCRAVFVVKKDGTQIHDVQQAPTGDTVMGMSPLLPSQIAAASAPAPARRPGPFPSMPPRAPAAGPQRNGLRKADD